MSEPLIGRIVMCCISILLYAGFCRVFKFPFVFTDYLLILILIQLFDISVKLDGK